MGIGGDKASRNNLNEKIKKFETTKSKSEILSTLFEGALYAIAFIIILGSAFPLLANIYYIIANNSLLYVNTNFFQSAQLWSITFSSPFTAISLIVLVFSHLRTKKENRKRDTSNLLVNSMTFHTKVLESLQYNVPTGGSIYIGTDLIELGLREIEKKLEHEKLRFIGYCLSKLPTSVNLNSDIKSNITTLIKGIVPHGNELSKKIGDISDLNGLQIIHKIQNMPNLQKKKLFCFLFDYSTDTYLRKPEHLYVLSELFAQLISAGLLIEQDYVQWVFNRAAQTLNHLFSNYIATLQGIINSLLNSGDKISILQFRNILAISELKLIYLFNSLGLPKNRLVVDEVFFVSVLPPYENDISSLKSILDFTVSDPIDFDTLMDIAFFLDESKAPREAQ